MGALDSKAFSGVAFAAALLLVVSAIVVTVTDDGISGDLAKYILLIAGIFALIYSFSMFSTGASFVRKLEGVLLIVTGIAMAATCFMDNPGDFIVYDGILAFITIIFALLAYWTSGTYGAMYVSAVLAAFEVGMAIYSIKQGYDGIYAAVILAVFAVFLVVDAVVRPYVIKGSESKTREVIEASRAQKKEGSMAKRTKATPKAKKAAPKSEPKPVEEKPAAKKAQGTASETFQAPAQAPVVEEKPAEKKEQKRPDKATGEFMEKLMRSQDANRAAKIGTKQDDAAPIVRSEPKPVRTVELPQTAALKAERAKAVESVEEKPVEAPAEEPAAEEAELEAPAVEEKPVMEDAPEESVISEPIQSKECDLEFRTKDPDWGHVAKDSAIAEAPAVEEKPVVKPESPAEEPAAAEDAPETPVEEAPAVEEKPVMEDAPEESVISEPIRSREAESPAVENPDWSSVSEESDAEEPEEDIYTDNSPEALVRRAAWNKGLRCRRNYGDHGIPVAFVKGKVAVYVADSAADASADDVLREEGWTVLRFDATKVTDGKAEGDAIAEAVKANVKTVKKRKARK